jgi:carbonic anhydrase/acetyltransferase-like protein (isoleucine patch superfamily)
MLYSLDGEYPVLEGGNFVAPDAALIGRVRMKKGASVWFGVVARGDNEWITVGEKTNIQDLSMLHTDIGFPLVLGDRVTVGHRVILHGCTINGDALIGMGSILMNGAKIGKNTIIGAGSLVGEGKEIPDGVLALGSPAKVIRDVTDQEIRLIAASAEHYYGNAQRYMKGLKAKR